MPYGLNIYLHISFIHVCSVQALVTFISSLKSRLMAHLVWYAYWQRSQMLVIVQDIVTSAKHLSADFKNYGQIQCLDLRGLFWSDYKVEVSFLDILL